MKTIDSVPYDIRPGTLLGMRGNMAVVLHHFEDDKAYVSVDGSKPLPWGSVVARGYVRPPTYEEKLAHRSS